jgi:hypothetical protein
MMKIAIGKLVAVAVLTGSSLVVGVAATSAPAAADDTPTACQQLWDKLPTAMQDDIRAAVQLPLRERRRALRAIRYAALHGGYGDEVQAWAEKVRAHRIELWQQFPDQLKADIRAARALPLREQRRAMRTVRDAALEGAYGDQVQHWAEKRREFVEGCPGVVTPFVDTGTAVS